MTPVTKITKKSELIELFNSNLIVIQPVKSVLDDPNVCISNKDSFYYTKTKLVDITNLALVFEVTYSDLYGTEYVATRSRSISCRYVRILDKQLNKLRTISINELDLER